MMTRTLPLGPIEDACYQADLDPDEAIRTNYSGRYMYGRNCFGLVVDSLSQAVRVLLELAFDSADCGTSDSLDRDVIEELGQSMATDNMGLSMIVYFPGFNLEGADDEEADDDV
jgi:hypothetical protein